MGGIPDINGQKKEKKKKEIVKHGIMDDFSHILPPTIRVMVEVKQNTFPFTYSTGKWLT